MQPTQQTITAIRKALDNEPGVNLHEHPVRVAIEAEGVVLSGTLPDIKAKRLAHYRAVAAAGEVPVLDHLKVTPSEVRADEVLAEAVHEALSGEPVFREYHVVARPGTENNPDAHAGDIEVTVADGGVVTLTGRVQSLTHKRLADVLTWWVPGVVGVHDCLHVEPAEQDNDGEITDALRMVLEKDPWIDAGEIQVHVRDKVVTLEGLAYSEHQRHMAELDAWYVLGVHQVSNKLVVRT
jgi:osmotically-inducible protein OsmY